MSSRHPIVVIGAGPVGLAAAAHLLERGQKVVVLEAGASAGAAMGQWGHIKLFSTWRYNIDAAARRLLETPAGGYDGGWAAPRETRLPTGAEMVNGYLAPLAAHPSMAPRIRYGHKVTAVTRVLNSGAGVDLSRSAGRDDSLFLVRTEADGATVDVTARAVIDASGTWGMPNPAGRSGIPAIGEDAARAAGFVSSPLPDVLGADRAQFAGKAVLVLGAGHSAANTLLALARLRQQDPATTILWGLRGTANPVRLYGGGAADELPARGQLGTSLRRFVDNGDITLVENVAVASIASGATAGVELALADGRTLSADVVVPATGFRPDLSILSELRLDLDPVVQAPRALGPLIDPEFHSCGTVEAHGERVLSHPEPNFYLVGMKSYGRAPTFLMATGYEQVRSIAAALAGDRAAADAVELQLPETGVCSTDLSGSCDAPAAGAENAAQAGCGAPEPSAGPEAGGCCGAPEPVTIGFATGTLHGFTEVAGAHARRS
ncbi:glycine/D-amino acid oxidase-like deaminating enzyme [Arthrobacter stackebrandtii]|uniref:Glycine/D-amino acid oxidase-like deaminating enzyme n=1 Tax=Arthrobacter stackebrandtii TaxID=272161 RepID=A0ABS4YZV1_9MICC|nr:FAD-dependent oxidoreductase [Arthrobacter stackebrandtii]MBP2414075.1 glycine/D-amino acid oxidase-like deaminating enzyme [Arthrobacter stackebrandtii]PYG99379.1 flavoprotein [Arthrobacter stackebrandtii]